MNETDKASARKKSGNYFFDKKDFHRAARCYADGIKLAESPSGFPGENAPLGAVYIDCLNNLAACHLGTKDYTKAKEACIRLISTSLTIIALQCLIDCALWEGFLNALLPTQRVCLGPLGPPGECICEYQSSLCTLSVVLSFIFL